MCSGFPPGSVGASALAGMCQGHSAGRGGVGATRRRDHSDEGDRFQRRKSAVVVLLDVERMP